MIAFLLHRLDLCHTGFRSNRFYSLPDETTELLIADYQQTQRTAWRNAPGSTSPLQPNTCPNETFGHLIPGQCGKIILCKTLSVVSKPPSDFAVHLFHFNAQRSEEVKRTVIFHDGHECIG